MQLLQFSPKEYQSFKPPEDIRQSGNKLGFPEIEGKG